MADFIVIGITGGVGAGKSTIISYLKDRYNAVVLIADIIAKQLMEPGGETYSQILDVFGADLSDDKGYINKEALAKRIFELGYGTEKINEMVHPAVVKRISRRIEAERLESRIDPSDRLHLVVVEAALLFEGHADVLCDEIWYIHAAAEERIERLMKSRGYSKEKCEAIIESQLGEKEFKKRCQVVIDNNSEFEDVKRQIDDQITRIKIEFDKEKDQV